MNINASEIFDFIDTFLDGEIKDRWAYVFSKKPQRWKSLDPYQLWGRSKKAEKFSEYFLGDFSNFLNTYKLDKFASTEVLVARFGHDLPGITKSTFYQALLGNESPLEGLVLLKPKELVVCFTHEDDVRVFESLEHKSKRIHSD